MKISKTHQKFSKELKEPRALTNPEDFLGPNWKDVINFWLYVDTLSWDQKRKISDRYWTLDEDVRSSAYDASWDAAKDVVGCVVVNSTWHAAINVASWYIFGYATDELIAHHKLLEQGKSPTFLPLCVRELYH
jgi:hypothetical protein